MRASSRSAPFEQQLCTGSWSASPLKGRETEQLGHQRPSPGTRRPGWEWVLSLPLCFSHIQTRPVLGMHGVKAGSWAQRELNARAGALGRGPLRPCANLLAVFGTL